jgi:hypothetical protein
MLNLKHLSKTLILKTIHELQIAEVHPMKLYYDNKAVCDIYDIAHKSSTT